jgi:hypothetical protein
LTDLLPFDGEPLLAALEEADVKFIVIGGLGA